MNKHVQSKTLQDWEAFKSGKSKIRTWNVDSKTKNREMKYKGIEEIRSEKAEKLKKIRKDELKLSQSQLAGILHVSLRTLQGWEIGKSSVPEPVLILIELFRDIPAVRKRLETV